MAKIWRVAHKDSGRGPYDSKVLFGDVMSHRPLPKHDGLNDRYRLNPNWRYGFKTLKDLKKWFDDISERMEMHDGGLRVYRLDVDEEHIRYGRSQLVFVAGKERLLYQKTLMSI